MTKPRQTLKKRGILISYIDCKVEHGRFDKIKALLDTGASRAVVYRNSRLILTGRAKARALRKLRFIEDVKLYDAVERGAPAYVKTLHGQKRLQLRDLAVVCMRAGGTEVTTIAVLAEPDSLPPEVEIIVDADTLRLTNIDTTALLQNDASSYEEACTTESPPMTKEWNGFIETKKQALLEASRLTAPFISREHTDDIYLSEIKCGKFLKENPDPFKVKELTPEMVVINDDISTLSKAEQALLRKDVQEFGDIFGGVNALPKLMKDQPPAKILFHETAKPVSCPKPRWGPQQEQLLRMWTASALESGLLVPAGKNCIYANRPHIVGKPDKSQEDVLKGVRVTGDYVQLNDGIPKRPLNIPDMEIELRKHRGAKLFTVADAVQGYHQLALDQKSRERCAIWTPLGLMLPTRLWMGIKNAGTIYQEAVTGSLDTMPEGPRKQTSNYMDDFLTSGKSFEEYRANTRAFFEMCRARGITLNPAKTRLGFERAKLLGREVDGQSIKVHSDNLRALRECRRPEDVSQLKSFLGICAYARKHVKNFAFHSERLTNLTRKKVRWLWSKEVDDAFLRLKAKVLENFPLHVPDMSKPFYLFTDASDVGMGAHLCQLRNPVKDEDLHLVPDDDKLTIAFYSKSFDLAMQQRPVYYREAKAMFWGLEKSKEFLERNPHQTVVATDHAPLQWIKSTNKGAVSAWLIESTAEPDYRVVYVPGPTNTTADALSRVPMVSPNRLNMLGAEHAWDAMLKLLPVRHSTLAKVHVWAAQHTVQMQRKVQAWRQPSNAINVRAPKSMLKHTKDFDLILSAPSSDEAPVVAHHILKELIAAKSNATYACLVPLDLIKFIPSGGDLRTDVKVQQGIREKLESTTKLVFTQTGFAWLIFDSKERTEDKVIMNFALESYLPTDTAITPQDAQSTQEETIYPTWEVADLGEGLKLETGPKGTADCVVYGNITKADLKVWIEAQTADSELLKKEYKDKILTRDDGLILIQTDVGNKIYVPTGTKENPHRKRLTIRTHREMAHGLIRRVRKVLTAKYTWPKMISDIMTWIAECHECPLAKAKKNIKHNLYSPTDVRMPCSVYGVDYYGIAKSKNGYVGVLTVTDLFVRWVKFIPVKDLSATTFARVLMEHVVFARGAFKVLVSDGANAFVGETAKQLASLLKIEKVETFHYPQGNSTTERHHVLLGEFLRILPENKRDIWDEEIASLSYAANMCVNSSTGFSAFEMDRGFQPNASADLMFQDLPQPILDPETFAKTSDEQKAWVQRMKDLHKIARECDIASKEITIQRLNNPARATQTFTAGNKVLFYVPIQQGKKDKEEQIWKSKHLTHWRRGIILAKRSSSTYDVQDLQGKTFLRSVSLIKKDTSIMPLNPTESKHDETVVEHQTLYTEGMMIAILDDSPDDDKAFGVAQILKVTENGDIEVRHFGTIDKTPKKAKYKPMWSDENDMYKLSLKVPSKRYKSLTGTISKERILEEVELSEQQTLTQKSLESLTQRGLKMLIQRTKVVSKKDKARDILTQDDKIAEDYQELAHDAVQVRRSKRTKYTQ